MKRIVSTNGVVYYRSDIIPCIHGFSARIGGVSTEPHTKGLNLGLDRGDGRETVIENLKLFSEALRIDAESIISVSQIHSDNIRTVSDEHRGEGYFKIETEPCDGYITNSDNITLGVRSADCVPILLYAPESEGFGGAVAALHAGWRGTALGIVRRAVEKLSFMGAQVGDIKAAIGPSIGPCCYCVKEDFYQSFRAAAGDALTEGFVTPVGDKVWVADLKGANREILYNSGLSLDNIDLCKACTCCEPSEFYSHRYSKGQRGTMLSVISRQHREGGSDKR